MKLRKTDACIQVQCKKRTSFALVALLAAAPLSGCKEEKPGMRCYDYREGTLQVYVESKDRKAGAELGIEVPLAFRTLGIKDTSLPLAYMCTKSGHLIWVTKDTVYVKKISQENKLFAVGGVLENSHIKPDEYAVPGVRVISAGIWENPEAHFDNITVATLTNTGLFQAARYSLEGLAGNKIDRAIFDFGRKLSEESRWPSKGISGGAVRVIDSEKFVVIPLGEKGSKAARNIYHISFSGQAGQPFVSREMDITTLKLWKNYPELRNVLEISSPVRYDRQLGGWVVNIVGEKESGETFTMFPIVTP